MNHDHVCKLDHGNHYGHGDPCDYSPRLSSKPRSPGDGTVSSLARPQQRLWAGKQIKTYFEICFTFLNDQAFNFLND